MRFLLTLIMAYFISAATHAQENIAINDLLNEANASTYSDPEQAGKIASYIVSQNENNIIHAQAKLILAKSSYVRGTYNTAIKNALEAKVLAQKTNDEAIKFETLVFAIKLLRILDLETVAKKYTNELTSLKKQTKDNELILKIDGKLKQDDALVLLKSGKYLEADKSLKNAASLIYKTEDSISKNEIKIAKFDLLLKSEKLQPNDIALKDFESISASDFEKIQVLDIIGRQYFHDKEYQKAISSFEDALALSINLPNIQFKNKSLEGLSLSYLALEDTDSFFKYKQQSNLVSTQIVTDKNLATNTVFNFINSYLNEISESEVHQSYTSIYVLGGLLILLILIGVSINYMYTSKAKEYLTIYKYISPKQTDEKHQPKVENIDKSSIIPVETEQMLLQKLSKFEMGKKFTNQNMSIALLASQFDTNTKYLSEVINRHKGKNFNGYINELRINYIIEKLKTDPIYFNYKISYLAEECGFSSHSSFTTVFKSVTGISPTKFMNYLQHQKESA